MIGSYASFGAGLTVYGAESLVGSEEVVEYEVR